MQTFLQNKRGLAFVVIVVLLSAWIWHEKSVEGGQAGKSRFSAKDGIIVPLPGTEVNAHVSDSTSEASPILAPSLMGTDADCSFELDNQGKLIATMGLRRCFDYFFSALGEKSEAQLIADIRRQLEIKLPPSARPYALELLGKYVQYRHSEVPPALNLEDQSPESLRMALESLKGLRLRYFTREEAQAFFGDDEAYDQYNIAVMGVLHDGSLSKQQKDGRIASLAAQLPPSLAKNMSASQQYNLLQLKTDELKARGGSAQEVYALRESIVGAQAAERLAKVDAENADWRQRVSKFLDLRAQILASGGGVAEQQQAITALRNTTFSAQEERIRAQTYESMRDNGDHRIF